MPKRKEPELTAAEQYKRFKEAAKKAGLTDSEEEFEQAFASVVKTVSGRPATTPARRARSRRARASTT